MRRDFFLQHFLLNFCKIKKKPTFALPNRKITVGVLYKMARSSRG